MDKQLEIQFPKNHLTYGKNTLLSNPNFQESLSDSERLKLRQKHMAEDREERNQLYKRR